MENLKLKDKVLEVLKKDDRLWDEDKKELNQTLLLDLVEKIDEKVIDLLLQKEELRDKFFVKIKDVYVFKTNEFRFFIEENKVDNSYTAYKNRIGLTDGKRFLKDTNDVVLNWPYKDCVLEGGQSTEEGMDVYFEYDEKNEEYEQKQDKRKEIFFNEVLASDEIDRLFDPKALVNWKRYTKNGEQEVKEIKRDEEGTIKENLIIKGNNLLALHSLEKQFAGKVKLIYIDPPYFFLKDTRDDTFSYNSNFKLSTWLTFMKNRLEVARELLRDDGFIFVQIGGPGLPYLQSLMNEIFGIENNIALITTKVKAPSGVASGAQMFFDSSEYLLAYSVKEDNKNWNEIKINSEIIDENSKTSDSYKYILEYINYDKKILVKEIDRIKIYKIDKKDFEVKQLKKEKRTKENYYLLRNKIFRTASLSGGTEKKVKKVIENYNNKDLYLYEYIPLKGKNKGKKVENLIYKKEQILMLKDFSKPDHQKKILWKQEHISNILYNDWWQGISNEGKVKLKNGKKPEILLKTIIDITTQESDLVLDYHLGSGTTAAVAHKMRRQYIGIEQLDYGKNDSVLRLQNVTNGDKTGISKFLNWQGGGDFIYFELAKWNETAKEKILACESLKGLIDFFDEMYERYFLNYNLKIKEFKEQVIHEEEFKKLSLEEQKKMFITMLDNNQMYVNKTEMEDGKYGINEENINLTNQFYNLKE